MRQTALILVLLLGAACGAEVATTEQPASSASQSPTVSRKPSAVLPAAPRMVVRNATMRVIVADTAKAVESVSRSVESLGGYVVGSEVWREGELLRARLSVRVPSEKLRPALAAIRQTARRVENETLASEDVTGQYVDLASQLRNLEATENELRELLVNVRSRAKRAADILEVHQQLVAIRGEIETTKGRMQHLSATTAMSSVAVEVVPDAIAKPVTAGEWRPAVVVKDATRALLAALRNITTAVIWIVIYVVPVCGVIALTLAATIAMARRLRRPAA